MKRRGIVYKTLKDVEKEVGVSKKKVQSLFNKYLEVRGIPKEAFKFRASWGGWLIAFPDFIYEDFVGFVKNPQEPESKVVVEKRVESPPGAQERPVVEESHVDRVRARLLAGGFDEGFIERVLHVVRFLEQKGLYGKSLVSVSRELRESGLSEKKVREITSYYRVALLYEY